MGWIELTENVVQRRIWLRVFNILILLPELKFTWRCNTGVHLLIHFCMLRARPVTLSWVIRNPYGSHVFPFLDTFHSKT